MSHPDAHRLRPRFRPIPHGSTGAVLVLLAHPTLHRSRVNRAMAQAIRDLPGVTVHDLYEAYPDLDIDVPREQALLQGHAALVWQHPLFWYSTPAMLKEWQDLVLEFGWAYGPEGTALQGKPFLQALTTGAPDAAYHPEGFARHTLDALLAPITQTARLCGLERLPPFAVHGTHRMEPAQIEAAAASYRAAIAHLRDRVAAVH
jgi:glutathione-regulated potassium-efflux system ancillary protein KefG